MKLITKEEQKKLDKMRRINDARSMIKRLIPKINKNGHAEVWYLKEYENILNLVEAYFKKRGYKLRVTANDFLIIE